MIEASEKLAQMLRLKQDDRRQCEAKIRRDDKKVLLELQTKMTPEDRTPAPGLTTLVQCPTERFALELRLSGNT